MRKALTFKKIGISVLIVLALMQLIRIDKTNPEVDPKNDISTISRANPEITTILKNACYDCHSNEVYYPWYSNVAPISWWIKNHVNEGREHLNFSVWGTYSPKKSDHKLEECVEMLEEKEMPLYSYTIIHEQAKITEEQRSKLIAYFKALRTDELPESEFDH